MITSLSISDPALLKEDRLDRLLIWFPLVGWIIGAHRQVRRTNRAKSEVHALLCKRESFPAQEWRSAGFDPAFVESIAKALPTRLTYLPNHYFLPKDSFRLLTLDWEGIGLIEAEVAVFKALGAKRIKPIDVNVMCAMQSFADYVRTLPGRAVAE